MLPSSVSGVVPIEEMRGDDQEDTALLRASYEKAEAFLLGQKWCFGFGDVYFGDGVGGVVSVFLVRIDPVPTGVDQWLWVIVGDLPPAYLVIDQSPTPVDALKCYIAEIRRWVSLAHESKTSSDVIPTNVPAAPEFAEKLDIRVNLLEEVIIPLLESRK